LYAGDVIGSLLNRAEQTIAYFKNGIDLGTAFIGVAEEKLYPCVGMQTHEEEVGDTQITSKLSASILTQSTSFAATHPRLSSQGAAGLSQA
jgi:hypothetical protein